MPYTEFHYTPTGTGVISGKEVLEQTEDAINDLGGQISGDVQTAIDTANNALNTANTASADAQNAVNTANTAYTAATNAQNTANTAQNTASNALTAAQNAQNDVNALGNRVTTAEGNITQNTNAITGLTTRMGTAEGNITTLQNDVITAQGTATSAQNTATLARGQAYVVRYASVAVSDNSTVPYTDLNNTDNIKANDLLLDINGKFYQITSVDTSNETVSVTTPLTQLAVDSSVVHKSGVETVAGNKTFSGNVNIYNSDTSVDAKYLVLKNQKVKRGSTTETGKQFITFQDKDSGTLVSHETHVSSLGNTEAYINVSNLDANSQRVVGGVKIIKTPTETWFVPDNNNTVSSGTSYYKWSDVQTYKVNSLEPSSLSLPGDRSARIDISSYITNLGNGGNNQYIVPANGYIWLHFTSINSVLCYSQTSGGLTNYAQTFSRYSGDGLLYAFFPVRKNDYFIVQIYTSSTAVVQNAFFIPCQGNV